MCWRLILEEFRPELCYIKGRNNIVADALSRLDMLSKKTNFLPITRCHTPKFTPNRRPTMNSNSVTSNVPCMKRRISHMATSVTIRSHHQGEQDCAPSHITDASHRMVTPISYLHPGGDPDRAYHWPTLLLERNAPDSATCM